jgi:hypothetical protein
MASPHRSESFFYDGPASPSILLVPTGDGDSFEVVLEPISTLMRLEDASPEQEDLLTVQPVGDAPALIEREPSHISSSPDERSLLTTDGIVLLGSSSDWIGDLAEQVAAKLDEGWVEEQLLGSPDVEIPTSESLVEARVSSGTSHFIYHSFFSCAYALLFYFIAELSAPAGPPEVIDVPTSIPVLPVSGDEAIGQILFFFISSLLVIDCLTCLFCCRCHTGRCEARPG